MKSIYLFVAISIALPVSILAQSADVKIDSTKQTIEVPTEQQSVVILKNVDNRDIDQFRPDLDWYEDSNTSRSIQASGNKRNAGLAFLGSLAIPGLGQAAVNKQWIKSSVFVTLEVVSLYAHLKNKDLGRDLERSYWGYVETGWSAAKYVGFLVDYHNFYYPDNPMSYNDLATPGSNLNAIITTGSYPSNVRQEWPLIDLQKLRALEARTLYGGTTGNAFSHNLPDYGSQQYYELVSKYFQFGPGWKDFLVGVDQVNWEKEGMSDAWFDGASKSKRFNDRLRTARSFASVIMVNHLISGFDALFSTRLHNHRIETAFSPQDGGTIHLSIRF
jgi:hypothetical protein